MSSNYYSDSYTSGDQKPSNYTNFSSDSYESFNYGQDNSYKKFDDYSTSFGSYSGFDSSQNNSQSVYSNFNLYDNQQNNFDGQTRSSDIKQAYRNDSLSFHDSFFNNNQQQQQQQQQKQIQPQPQQLSQQPLKKPVIPIQPPKPIQKFTLKDILQLQPPRQQYLKSLPIENLRDEPEYKVINNEQLLLLEIVNYYGNAIPDPELNGKARQLKQGRNIIDLLSLNFLIGYVVMSRRLQLSNQFFKRLLKGKNYFLIPCGLTALTILNKARTRNKAQKLLKSARYLPSTELAMHMFLSNSTKRQRIKIFDRF